MPVNIKEIRQLIKLMVDNDLTALDIESGSTKVSLKRGPSGVTVPAKEPAGAAAAAATAGPLAGQAAPAAQDEAEAKPADGLIEIKSPMVGTFYAAASPENDPFVSVSDAVSPESVVCIIEAMKVMNEIKAECSGTIAEVCVANAQPVEFGQVLFRVRPS